MPYLKFLNQLLLILPTLLGFSISVCAKSKPNIIFILTDDQGWADFGAPLDSKYPEASSSFLETPHMNRLASRGLVFSDAYAPAPNCTPTRRSILYGMSPARQKGTEFLGFFDPTGHKAIPQYLKETNSGYVCAIFGKWGEVLDGTWRNENLKIYPEALQFDYSDGRHTGNKTGIFYHHTEGEEQARRNYFVEPAEDPKLTGSVTSRAIDFLKKYGPSERPFYLQVNYYAIHTAYKAEPETIAKYASQPNPHRQMLRGIGPTLEELDAAIGDIVEEVKRLGLTDKTYIFLSSDNGGEGFTMPPWATPDLPPRNAPLRGRKGFLYEGGIRVPLIVVGPGVKPGTISRVPVSLFDLLPTFYELAGGNEALPSDIDGSSLAPILRDPTFAGIERAEPGLVFHRPFYKRQSHSALRQGDFKLVVTWDPQKAWMVQEFELFNLNSDIGEQQDLSRMMPDKAEAMKTALIDYLQKVDARMPGS